MFSVINLSAECRIGQQRGGVDLQRMMPPDEDVSVMMESEPAAEWSNPGLQRQDLQTENDPFTQNAAAASNGPIKVRRLSATVKSTVRLRFWVSVYAKKINVFFSLWLRDLCYLCPVSSH